MCGRLPRRGAGHTRPAPHDPETNRRRGRRLGRLASGGENGQIKLWPKDGKGEPVVLENSTMVTSLAVLADGRLASGDPEGQIKLWIVEEEKLVAALCLRGGRNLSKDEWARYMGSDTSWQPSCSKRPTNWSSP
jgi:hypothetical protein